MILGQTRILCSKILTLSGTLSLGIAHARGFLDERIKPSVCRKKVPVLRKDL